MELTKNIIESYKFLSTKRKPDNTNISIKKYKRSNVRYYINDEIYLTNKEMIVLSLLFKKLSITEISKEIGCGLSRVCNIICYIKRKLNIKKGKNLEFFLDEVKKRPIYKEIKNYNEE